MFEAEAREPGPALEVRCLPGGVAQVRRGAVVQEVRLEGLSSTVRATTLGMVLLEVSRARAPEPAKVPAAATAKPSSVAAPRVPLEPPGTSTIATSPQVTPEPPEVRAATIALTPAPQAPVEAAPATPATQPTTPPVTPSAPVAVPAPAHDEPALAQVSPPVAVQGAAVPRPASPTAPSPFAAHAPGTTFVPADAALVPPLTVNDAFAGDRAHNLFSLGLLASRGAHLDGLALSAGASFFSDAVDGVQVAGAFTSAGLVQGVQLAGAVTWAGADLRGAQAAGAAALAAHDTWGLQLAGGLAWTRGSLLGAQAAPVSLAGSVRGLQLGLLNIGGDVDGAQVGLVNIADHVRGLQLGLVNVAQSATVPFGLVSLISDGGFRAAFFAGDSSLASVALKLGGRNFYSFLVAGWNPWQAGKGVSFGPGLGFRSSNALGWATSVEGSYQYLWQYPNRWTNDYVATLRVQQSYRLTEHFAVFAGLQAQLFRRLAADPVAPTPLPWVVHDSSSIRVTLSPGAVVGVEL